MASKRMIHAALEETERPTKGYHLPFVSRTLARRMVDAAIRAQVEEMAVSDPDLAERTLELFEVKA